MYLQVQYQQIADASEPDQASANPIPANCRYFQPQDRHLQIQIQQIADTSDPDQASTNPIPASCRCFRTQDRHLQIQIQQIADTSDPDQASTNPILANCRCFRTQDRHLQVQYQQIADTSTSGIHPYMYLQIQFQQVADASNPDQASAAPISASCRCFQPRPGICKSNSSKLQMLPTPARHLQIQFQQIADASNPDQASVAPKTTNQRCPPVNFLLKFAGGHLYCISISSNSYICLFLIHRGLSRPVSWHLFWTFPVFHRFPYALLWKSLPTRPLLLLSVPDGFCPR